MRIIMNIAIDEQLLDKIEAQIGDAERQKTRLDEYIGGLRDYYNGAKSYLQTASKLKSQTDPVAESKAFLSTIDTNDSNSFSPPAVDSSLETAAEAVNQSPTDETMINSPSHSTELNSEENSNQINFAPTGERNSQNGSIGNSGEETDAEESKPKISNEEFKKLPQFQAIKAVFVIVGEKISTDRLKQELFRRGWQPESELFDQNLISMLRYYRKKGVFDCNREKLWGISSGIEATIEKIIPASKELSDSDCSYEILRNSGLEWMHVTQIVTMMKQQYGYTRDKDAVSSTLRKAARRGKRFKFFEGNRFGVIDYATDAEKNVSAPTSPSQATSVNA